MAGHPLTESSNSGTVIVTPNQCKNPSPPTENEKPEHWVDSEGNTFQNPWDSWRGHSIPSRLKLFAQAATFPARPRNATSTIPLHTPTWGAQSSAGGDITDKLKTTWLGHACFLVEFPTRLSGRTRGIRILFDPVFSDRCSPSQWAGPKRFTPPPCKIEDIPKIEAVVISHNHYDHLDAHTIRTLLTRNSEVPHFFAPLGNGPFFESLGVPLSHIHIMDWWESKRVQLTTGREKTETSCEGNTLALDVTCTPCQHFTGRTLWDSYKTLWASWVVEEVFVSHPGTTSPVKVFFGGDTGYRAILDGQDEKSVPTCPAFKAIGEQFGGFDLAMIPIGAYLPRQFMSPIHCAPQDSVMLFKDIRAKRALGMHWGTWVLTAEEVFEPPKRLAEECRKAGIKEGAFTVCDIGNTLLF